MANETLGRQRFYTPVEGMEGVGAALVPHASVSMDQRRPEQLGGGTYSGMQVTEQVMEAIKRGNGGSLFYFEELPERPGYYSMHPTYPELGANKKGETPYKLRENVNRLYKGVASHFVNGRGEVDFRAGARFMDEFNARFTNGSSLEDPLLDQAEVRKERISWLCHELRIPEEEQDDFSRFAQSCIYSDTNDQYVFGSGNFFDIIGQWAYGGIQVEEELKGALASDQEFRDAVLPGIEQSKREILDLAGIDPKTERRMIIPTECNGSTYVNSQLFTRGYNVSQDGEDLGRFTVSFSAAESSLIKQRNKLREELQLMADNPIEKAQELLEQHCRELSEKIEKETDPDEKNRLSEELDQLQSDREEAGRQLLNQQISQSSQEFVTLQEEIDRRSIEDPGTELKWDYHEAVNAASFELEQPDGTRKTYYITLEGFAPESNVIMDHAGISDAVSIGIYSSEEEFRNYYLQDHARIPKDDRILTTVSGLKQKRGQFMERVSEEMFEFPKELCTQEIREQYQQMRDNRQEDMNMAYFGEGSDWEKSLKSQAEKNPRKPMMGIDIQSANSLYEPGHDRLIRRADAFASRIPEELRSQYETLVEAYRYLNHQVRDISDRELFMKNIASLKVDQLRNGEIAPEEEERVREEIRLLDQVGEEIGNRSTDDYMARAAVSGFLERILTNGTYEIGNEAEHLAFSQAMRPYGITEEGVISLAERIKEEVLPVTEVSMDVQEAIPGLAAGLIGTKDFRYAQQAVVDFAADNFDSALQGAFLPDERKALSALGMELYSQILIDGRPVSQLLNEKYGPENASHDLAKCEILAAAFRDRKIEFALGLESEEKGGRIPLNMHSKIPAVQESLERARKEREDRLRGKSEDWEIPRKGALPERPALNYVEMPLKYSMFERNARLRDYDFNMETGERTVKEDEKIGQPVGRGESIRIIYPLVESRDGNWVQAMGKDGTCGYIRKSRVDPELLESKVKNEEVRPLPRYRFAVNEYAFSKDYEPLFNDFRQYDSAFTMDRKAGIIETSVSRQEASAHRMKYLYGNALASDKSLPGSLGERFDQDEARFGVRFSSEVRCMQRAQFKKEAMEALEKDAGQLNGDPSRNNAMILVAETDHASPAAKKWIAEELGKGVEGALQNVGVIYVEDFMAGKDQQDLDDYLTGDREMSYGLRGFCVVHPGFQELLEGVKEYNTAHAAADQIRIVALGTELAQSDTRNGYEQQVERAAKFNYAAREIIDANLPQPGKRGVIYAGRAHMLAHPGLEDGKMILGLAQLYNQDTLAIQKTGDRTEVVTYRKDEVLDIAPVKTAEEKKPEEKAETRPRSGSARAVSFQDLLAEEEKERPARTRRFSESEKYVRQKERVVSKEESARKR